MTTHHRLLLGAHMSTSGGLEKSIERAESIGCTTLQIFTKSNRQWQAKELTEGQIALFKNAATQSRLSPVVAHACYLINLAAPDDTIYKKSIDALKIELARCTQLGIQFLVLHPGSAGDQKPEQALNRIVALGLNSALEDYNGQTLLLLENMAGQGSSMGSTLEQLAYMRNNALYGKKIGICLDTCHLFAAGYDLTSQNKYEDFWSSFYTIIGIPHLKVIHLNDSKKELGSHVDRHEDIGKGKIGLQAFQLLMNDPRLFDVAKIFKNTLSRRFIKRL